MTDITVAYAPGYLKWQLGTGHPTNPVRAQLATELLLAEGARLYEPAGTHRAWDEARLVHGQDYLDRLRLGMCGEWSGSVRPDLADAAALLFRGTVGLTDQLLAARSRGAAPAIWFNPMGAKHHAQRDRSGGFCALNDMAWAAARLTRAGLRVAYLDWDVHHGDGVEELMRMRPDVPTFSVHQGGIYPGTGMRSDYRAAAYNVALDAGDGDAELLAALADALEILERHQPDVILVAAGADGLAGDPLASLEYTLEGLAQAGAELGQLAGRLGAHLLVGGAGGYQPLTETPTSWAAQVLAMAQGMDEGLRQLAQAAGS